jgi:urea transport system substrate-binding protein
MESYSVNKFVVLSKNSSQTNVNFSQAQMKIHALSISNGAMSARMKPSKSSIISHRLDVLSVGLFIPTSGAAGIWGPSCRACAEIAADEINQVGGVNGREVVLKIFDAGDAPAYVAGIAEDCFLDGEIDAIVGMHTSDVREALAKTVGGKLPYVYTPLYEGGERTPGVFCIGETPSMQLLPAAQGLSERYKLRRWYLVGNDYVWPHASHAVFRQSLASTGGMVCGERYFPFGTTNFDTLLEDIATSEADAVLVSLVGSDAIHFNKQFGRSGLSEQVLRLSCAVEENVLLAIGAEHSSGLFAVSGYFRDVKNIKNDSFKERYHSRYGTPAPQLNSIGQSIYEGMHFLKALSIESETTDWCNTNQTFNYGGARDSVFSTNKGVSSTIFLAEAFGHDLKVVDSYPSA